MPKRKSQLPGCIYQNKNRYWWKVKLPGTSKTKAIPLIPQGGRYATKDFKVAEELAREILKRHRQKNNIDGDDRTIAGLVSKYLVYAKAYYGEDGEKQARYQTTSLLDMYSTKLAEEFSPKDLRRIQEAMIDNGLARKTINDRIARIKRVFKWDI